MSISEFFGQKGVSVQFEFWDQIWNPPIILHSLGLSLLLFSHFYFLTYHDIFKILQIARAVNFFRNRFFKVRFGISAPKDIIMAGVEIGFLKKMVITTWPKDLLGIFRGEGAWRVLYHRKGSSRVSVLGVSTIILKKSLQTRWKSLIIQ